MPAGSQFLILLSPLAVRTGLEPATSGVTGRHSNRLNYRTIFLKLYVLCFQVRGIRFVAIASANLRRVFYSSKFF